VSPISDFAFCSASAARMPTARSAVTEALWKLASSVAHAAFALVANASAAVFDSRSGRIRADRHLVKAWRWTLALGGGPEFAGAARARRSNGEIIATPMQPI